MQSSMLPELLNTTVEGGAVLNVADDGWVVKPLNQESSVMNKQWSPWVGK